MKRKLQRLRQRIHRYLTKLHLSLAGSPLVGLSYCQLHHRFSVARASKFEKVCNCALSMLRLPDFPDKPEFIRKPEFPPNAWRLKLSKDHSRVSYGNNVEQRGLRLFEGVWNDDFDKFAFLESTNLYGSGLELSRSAIVAPPTHMFECLFLIQDKKNDTVVVSNSLACCIAGADLSLQEEWLEELSKVVNKVINEQTAAGAYSYHPLIYEDKNAALYSLFFHNFEFSPKQAPKIILRLDDQFFQSFDQYQSFVHSTLEEALRNGASERRANGKLEAVSCVSSGYDSTAATAVGVALGVRAAMTLDLVVNGHSDSGAHIADELGVRCYSFVHPAGQNIPILAMEYSGAVLEIAWEFIGTAGFGDDILFAAFESMLPRKIMLDGKLGDGVWAKNAQIGPGMPTPIPFSKSMNEFRLRVGFAQIPVPSIGAQFPESIKRISQTAEMKPWSVGGGYDRPIPRRLVEQAGVQRMSFGQQKKAASPEPLNRDELKLVAIKRMIDRYRI